MYALYFLLLLPLSILSSDPNQPVPSPTVTVTVTVTETVTETATALCSDDEPQPTYAEYKIEGEHWVGQINLETYHETNLDQSICCEDIKIVNTAERIAKSFTITLAFCRDNFDKVHSVWGYEYMISEGEDATRIHIFSSDSVLNPGEQIVLPGFCVLVKKIKNFLAEKQFRFSVEFYDQKLEREGWGGWCGDGKCEEDENNCEVDCVPLECSRRRLSEH